MSATVPAERSDLGTCLVTGGAGFLAGHLVRESLGSMNQDRVCTSFNIRRLLRNTIGPRGRRGPSRGVGQVADRAAGHILSLIASARLHGLEPEAYLRDLIRVLPFWPRDRFLELAPKFWAETRARLDARQLDAEVGAIDVPDAVAVGA